MSTLDIFLYFLLKINLPSTNPLHSISVLSLQSHLLRIPPLMQQHCSIKHLSGGFISLFFVRVGIPWGRDRQLQQLLSLLCLRPSLPDTGTSLILRNRSASNGSQNMSLICCCSCRSHRGRRCAPTHCTIVIIVVVSNDRVAVQASWT